MIIEYLRDLPRRYYLRMTAINLTCFGLIGYNLYYDILDGVQSQPYYKKAIKLLESNEAAKKVLGTPMLIKNFDVFNKENYVKEDISCIHIPVVGPNKTASYFIWVEKEDDIWIIKTARVDFKDDTESDEINIVDSENAVVVTDSG